MKIINLERDERYDFNKLIRDEAINVNREEGRNDMEGFYALVLKFKTLNDYYDRS